MESTQPYSEKAQSFFNQYRSLSFEQVHHSWIHLLDAQSTGQVLDVGAGSGRDAAALAERGFEVLAVEPAKGMRLLAMQATRHLKIQWLNDQLPDLRNTQSLGRQFNYILLSAVWMHLPASQRPEAFNVLSQLLAPSGLLVISLRNGPEEPGRSFYPVSKGELDALAKKRGLRGLPLLQQQTDQLGRNQVTWETVAYQMQP